MFCYLVERKFSDFSFSLDNAAIKRHLPYMCALELTYRCNQSCLHCYCNLNVNDKQKSKELTTEKIKRILDEATDAGCFWLLLTGGEVLIREDFWQIYLYALKKGMLIEVFTNATLINKDIALRFGEFPPLGVDISIYGSKPHLHDKITATKGSFKKTMQGIEWLKKYKVNFSLKTILMTLNYHDLENLRLLAKNLGAKFRFDTLICPRNNGDLSPTKYRLTTELMAELDIKEDFETCNKIFTTFWNKKPKKTPTCGAGVFAFNINPYGILSPCTMFLSFQYPLKDFSFLSIWKKLVSDHKKNCENLIDIECRNCSMLLICSNCPAWAEIETKMMSKKVEYLCAYAKCLEKKYFEKREEMEYAKKNLSKTTN